jgi:hippurate hydrolase
MRASAQVTVVQGYPAVVNDAASVELVRGVVGDVLSSGAAFEIDRLAVAEDFSRVIELIPGAMFYLGVRRPGDTQPRGMHTATFDLDEAALPVGAAMLAGTAMRFLDE